MTAEPRVAIASVPLEAITAEAERLATAAVVEGLELRLMGGVAVYLSSPTARLEPYLRTYADIDFAVGRRDARRAAAFLEAAGYQPERMFNALHGAQRLNFQHPAGRWSIDVIIDELRMSHALDFRGRLNGPRPTLLLADLLLTKLQIWETNPKDVGDIVCLLADHDLVATERPDAIDLSRIVAVTRTDWGLWRTVQRNLEAARDEAAVRVPTGPRHEVGAQVAALVDAIVRSPKTLAWKARARIGERVQWYMTPEDVRHHQGRPD